MSTEKPSASALPPSLGPGAQVPFEGQKTRDIVRDVQEMRKHYNVTVEPTVLKVGYRINDATRNYEIRFDNAPLSGFRKWLCYGGRGRAVVSGTFLLDMMRGAENMTGQPLSQREAEGFTLHAAKRMQYGFVGMGVALATGYGMAARGRKQMKFPFKKPKPIENYDTFPFRRMPLLTGNYARLAWQTTRANIYAALGIIFLSPLFRSMGESVMAVGLYRDERTREKIKAIKGGLDRINMNRRASGSSRVASRSGQQAPDESSSDTAYDRGENQVQEVYGESANSSYEGDFSTSTSDAGVNSDMATRQREVRQSGPPAYSANRQPSQSSQWGARQDQQSPGDPSSPTDFLFDGVSSEAEHDPDRTSSQLYQRNTSNKGAGSTWDRIRQSRRSPKTVEDDSSQTSVSSGGGWRKSSSESNSSTFAKSGDSFSFSTSDSNRALAKEQAQKEFDNMLERERRESSSADYDRASLSTEIGGESSQQSTRSSSAWERRRK